MDGLSRFAADWSGAKLHTWVEVAEFNFPVGAIVDEGLPKNSYKTAKFAVFQLKPWVVTNHPFGEAYVCAMAVISASSFVCTDALNERTELLDRVNASRRLTSEFTGLHASLKQPKSFSSN